MMLVDCNTCPVRHVRCADCMVTALMTVPHRRARDAASRPDRGGLPAATLRLGLALDRAERRAVSVLLGAGLVSVAEANAARAVPSEAARARPPRPPRRGTRTHGSIPVARHRAHPLGAIGPVGSPSAGRRPAPAVACHHDGVSRRRLVLPALAAGRCACRIAGTDRLHPVTRRGRGRRSPPPSAPAPATLPGPPAPSGAAGTRVEGLTAAGGVTASRGRAGRPRRVARAPRRPRCARPSGQRRAGSSTGCGPWASPTCASSRWTSTPQRPPAARDPAAASPRPRRPPDRSRGRRVAGDGSPAPTASTGSTARPARSPST